MTAHEFPALVLWRHAEAEDPVHGRIADAARALTARGQGQARQMATWLATRLPLSTRILVSPALRTMQTAGTLERPLDIDERVGLSASPQSILAATKLPLTGIVVVVGHQPTLGELAASLLQHNQALDLERGEIVWIEFPAGNPRLKIRLTPQQITPGY